MAVAPEAIAEQEAAPKGVASLTFRANLVGTNLPVAITIPVAATDGDLLNLVALITTDIRTAIEHARAQSKPESRLWKPRGM